MLFCSVFQIFNVCWFWIRTKWKIHETDFILIFIEFDARKFVDVSKIILTFSVCCTFAQILKELIARNKCNEKESYKLCKMIAKSQLMHLKLVRMNQACNSKKKKNNNNEEINDRAVQSCINHLAGSSFSSSALSLPLSSSSSRLIYLMH